MMIVLSPTWHASDSSAGDYNDDNSSNYTNIIASDSCSAGLGNSEAFQASDFESIVVNSASI